jgi:hypothetical protein
LNLDENHTIIFSVLENPNAEVSSSYLQKCGILHFLPEERTRMRVYLVLFFSRDCQNPPFGQPGFTVSFDLS